jgi:hypothetical protein
VLIFGVAVGWWWPEEGPTTENERLGSFSVCVGGDGGQRKVVGCDGGQRGWWVVVVARGRTNTRK